MPNFGEPVEWWLVMAIALEIRSLNIECVLVCQQGVRWVCPRLRDYNLSISGLTEGQLFLKPISAELR